MKGKMNRDALSIILVRPKFHENLGSVARAMKNMGMHRLVIVDGCSPLHQDAYKLASGAEDILERAEEVTTLKEAIYEMGRVVGMTSRGGRDRDPLLPPEVLVQQIVPLSCRNSIGLVFGSEREGLTNEELSLCHLYVRIPSSEEFPSLNVAQAVMVVCYELFKASQPVRERPVQLVKAGHLERMFEHMEETLLKIEFLNPNNSKRVMRVLRSLYGRSRMDEREVQILQGIWSRIDWYLRMKGKGG
jgi:tRNA/rRNA methyltransferase